MIHPRFQLPTLRWPIRYTCQPANAITGGLFGVEMGRHGGKPRCLATFALNSARTFVLDKIANISYYRDYGAGHDSLSLSAK